MGIVGVGRLLALCLALGLISSPARAGKADPGCTVPGAKPPCPPAQEDPVRCMSGKCSANTPNVGTQPVHCGDQSYEATRQRNWVLNGGDPTLPAAKWDSALADACSFGSNRIRVFGALPDDSNPGACKPRSVKWQVPPDAANIVIRAYGAGGGDYRPASGPHPDPSQWSLGGAGGFAEFDGLDHTKPGRKPALPKRLGAQQIGPGDVLEVYVGCKGVDSVAADKSGATNGGFGGGSSAVLLLPRTGRAAQVRRPGAGPGIPLVIAGGGGGAGRDGVGGAYGADGGTGAMARPQFGGSGKGPGDGGDPGFNGNGGSGGTTCKSGFGGQDASAGGGGGAVFAQGAWGYNRGGAPGFSAFPGGGGGGGYGGGGSGSGTTSSCSNVRGAGGGAGGNYSLGSDPRGGMGSTKDGYVVITWTPAVLGGRDCYQNCRAVWAGCAWDGPGADGNDFLYRLPEGVSNVGVTTFGAPGGSSYDGRGNFGRVGQGGYAGASAKGTTALMTNDFGVVLGCPGGAGKIQGIGGGGGGSTAILLSTNGKPPISPGSISANTVIALAGGGGGAGGRSEYTATTWDPAGGAGGTVGESGGQTVQPIGPGHNGADWHGKGYENAAGQGGNVNGGQQGNYPCGYFGTAGQNGIGGNGGAGGNSGPKGGQPGRGVNGPGTQGNGGTGSGTNCGLVLGGGGGGAGYGGGGGGSAGGGGGGASFTGNTIDPIAPSDPANPLNDILFAGFEALIGQIPYIGGPLASGADLARSIASAIKNGEALPPPVGNAASDRNSNPLASGLVIIEWSCSRSVNNQPVYTCAPRPTSRPR